MADQMREMGQELGDEESPALRAVPQARVLSEIDEVQDDGVHVDDEEISGTGAEEDDVAALDDEDVEDVLADEDGDEPATV